MSIPPVLTGWIVTYAFHSTILLSLVLVVSFGLRSDAWRETLWKTALLGGILTATLQTAAGYTPLVGRWVLENDSAPPLSTESRAEQRGRLDATIREEDEGARQDQESQAGGRASVDDASGSARSAVPSARTSGSEEVGSGWDIPWITLLVGIWITVAALLLGRLALQHFWLFRVLAERRPIVDGPVPEMLAALRRNTGSWVPVRLTVSNACPTPIALGRSEICVPERFLTDLEPDQQRSALAHELAHLRRRDPLWQLTAGIIESIFFFQPLNRAARRRLRDTAENLSDDWAVRHTGSALGLAHCLADIASWMSPTTIPEVTLAMAEGGSPLLRRVQRLTEWREPTMYAAQLRPFASVILLALVAFVAPAVSQGVRSPDTESLRGGAGDRETLTVPAKPQNQPVVADSVIVHPNPSAPLAERWAWALAQRHQGGFWIAWGVDGPSKVVLPSGSFPISSNTPGPGTYTPNAPPLQRILAGTGAAAPSVSFVFGFAGEGRHSENIDWIRLRSFDAPLDLAGRPLLWLGQASTQESLAQLRRLYSVTDDPVVRKEIAAALSLHENRQDVIQAVIQAMDGEDDLEVRAEAVQWLPRAHPESSEAVAALLRVAFEDPAEEVRLEAVDALASLRTESAWRALVRIAETHPEWAARSEAAQVLARGGR
jgi:beta-lactamase regulating signal transducer with metallopeptidase domain